jgi:hypothetical protein
VALLHRRVTESFHALKGTLLIYIYAYVSNRSLEQANAIFNTILHAEVTPPSPRRPSSPSRPINNPVPPTTPTRRRLFNYNSPSASHPATPTRARRLDTPTDDAYATSPVVGSYSRVQDDSCAVFARRRTQCSMPRNLQTVSISTWLTGQVRTELRLPLDSP